MIVMRRRLAYIHIAIIFNVFCVGGIAQDFTSMPEEYTTQKPESVFGVYWDNDIFFKTDYYYTNGTGISFQSNLLRLKFLENFWLFREKLDYSVYRIELWQKIYTPVHTDYIDIWPGARPYAGTMTMRYSKDEFSRTKKTSASLIVGSIGRPSGTAETQNLIHEAIDNSPAAGWQYQISSDFIINLEQSTDYLLLVNRWFDISGGYNFGIGSYRTFGAGKLAFRLGKRNHIFGMYGPTINTTGSNRWQYYVYCEVSSGIKLFDATMHGGLFNPQNIYSLDYTDTAILNHRVESGVVFGFNGIQLRIAGTFISPEYSGGLSHAWGSVQINSTL